MNSLIKKLIVLTVFMTSLTAFSSAKADVLYDNGPVNGTVSAWTINFGYSVADTFTLTSQSTLTGLNFSLWNIAGDSTTAVDWTILSSLSGPLLGSPLASGIQSPVTQTYISTSQGYDINSDSIALGNISLAAGTYWIELQNAATLGGNPTFWDMNGGSSTVWESQSGYNPTGYSGNLPNASNTFQIIGSSVPEPASILLLAIGMIGLASLRKTRIH